MPHCEIFREGKWDEIRGSNHISEETHAEGFLITELHLKGGFQDGVFTREVEDEFGLPCKAHHKPKFVGTEVTPHKETSDSIE